MTVLGGYVGVPFAEPPASARDGASCWGLVQLVYREVAGIELPSYAEVSGIDLAAIADAMERDSALEPWSEPGDDARLLDVVVMLRRSNDGRRRPRHVGVCDGTGRVLHVEKATAAVLVPATHSSIRFRIWKYFRHAELVGN